MAPAAATRDMAMVQTVVEAPLVPPKSKSPWSTSKDRSNSEVAAVSSS
eukprot:CAMPEP_0178800284 /NCGR_PEP_ID=MMETSP0745-20121128/12748_1 /TAXON_ID=913974 /ORGANISM="Nitzschia punctata, Strain CCMP561" /LENGTH=47 /DNA_ID= /DNA_START= /DNA_END= /DNA_ORIENTATION=